MHGEGLLLEPRAEPRAWVVAVPDADQAPEQIAGLSKGVAPPSQFARRLAESGCLVVVPALISRVRGDETWNGRRQRLTHREFLYRSAYELGRHLVWDLSVLRASCTSSACLYTQMPGSNALAEQFCNVLPPLADAGTPSPGSAAFYLVSGVLDGAEGDLGKDGSGTTRPNANPCP